MAVGIPSRSLSRLFEKRLFFEHRLSFSNRTMLHFVLYLPSLEISLRAKRVSSLLRNRMYTSRSACALMLDY